MNDISIHEFFTTIARFQEAIFPGIVIFVTMSLALRFLYFLGDRLVKEFAELETDTRKKKKNDYLDYYDQLAEQDQGDPAIAYYDEVISEEMHK